MKYIEIKKSNSYLAVIVSIINIIIILFTKNEKFQLFMFGIQIGMFILVLKDVIVGIINFRKLYKIMNEKGKEEIINQLNNMTKKIEDTFKKQ